MRISTTFTSMNFNLQAAVWVDANTDYKSVALRMQNEEWDCYGEADLDVKAVLEKKTADAVLLILGIYCFKKENASRFKRVCLAIVEADCSDVWSYELAKVETFGAKIIDCDPASDYSLEEALKEFYDCGYEDGLVWFDTENLQGAEDDYQEYLLTVGKDKVAMSYVEWLVEESEYQLETSCEQFSEPEYQSSPRDKYYKFIDWDQMSQTYYRGSNTAYHYCLDRLREKYR